MLTALWLLAIQGAIGAFDTLYYHEWRARLVARGAAATSELRIHAIRDFCYAILFAGLPWLEWHGFWVVTLGAALAAEIVLTMIDFVVEMKVRKPLGDVFAGERITHAVMAIVYGGMLAHLAPVLDEWRRLDTALITAGSGIPVALRWILTAMSTGVFISGLRDMYAALELPGCDWPWRSNLSVTHRRGAPV